MIVHGSWTTTWVISAYYHPSCEFKPLSWWGVLDTTLCDKVCQRLVAGRSFSPHTLVSSTNKTDSHDITEILLKMALNIINQTKSKPFMLSFCFFYFYNWYTNVHTKYEGTQDKKGLPHTTDNNFYLTLTIEIKVTVTLSWYATLQHILMHIPLK